MFVDLLTKFLQMERACCVCRLTDKVLTDGREPAVFEGLHPRSLLMEREHAMFVDLLTRSLQMEREPAEFVDLLTRSLQLERESLLCL